MEVIIKKTTKSLVSWQFTAPMVKAMQEMRAEILKLKEEISTLKGRE